MATIEVDAKDLARLCDMADAFADELDDPDYDLIERNRAKVMTETDILD